MVNTRTVHVQAGRVWACSRRAGLQGHVEPGLKVGISGSEGLDQQRRGTRTPRPVVPDVEDRLLGVDPVHARHAGERIRAVRCSLYSAVFGSGEISIMGQPVVLFSTTTARP